MIRAPTSSAGRGGEGAAAPVARPTTEVWRRGRRGWRPHEGERDAEQPLPATSEAQFRGCDPAGEQREGRGLGRKGGAHWAKPACRRRPLPIQSRGQLPRWSHHHDEEGGMSNMGQIRVGAGGSRGVVTFEPLPR